MDKEEITTIFDNQAPLYDQQWSRLASIYDALHCLTSTLLSGLPPCANILCVGAGTGAEILYLAQRFPAWRFTAVEPSVPMINIFRRKAEEQGVLSRCTLHAGFLESLPPSDNFDAAIAFLVSQFILDRNIRSAFFRSIAGRLLPCGVLVSSDLTADFANSDSEKLLEVWFRLMRGADPSPVGVAGMRESYTRDVAVIPQHALSDVITSGGFEAPIFFFQAAIIQACYARRSDNP